MADSLVIPRRFNGPPDSGHGGYSAGLVAAFVDGPAEVALRAPPPLEVPLAIERRADGVVVARREGADVLVARPTTVDLEPPAPPPVEEARAAEPRSRFLDAHTHPFPTCFACGPERSEGDGLRLFAAALEDRPLHAAAWVPAQEFATSGVVDPLFVWSALDCPSSAPAMGGDPVVLASLAVDLRAPVAAGEPHVIGSWEIGRERRKRFTGVALWDAEGALRAVGRALWVALRPR